MVMYRVLNVEMLEADNVGIPKQELVNFQNPKIILFCLRNEIKAMIGRKNTHKKLLNIY